jgi:large subunit ribosomal protein L29
MNKELRNKTNEELCTMVMSMKLKLLEARFSAAAGQIEAPHTLPLLRKTIARILTILNERGQSLSIGTHGIILQDKKTKNHVCLTKQVMDTIQASNKKDDATQTSKATKKEVKSEVKVEKVNDLTQKAKAGSQMATKKSIIRRKVGEK